MDTNVRPGDAGDSQRDRLQAAFDNLKKQLKAPVIFDGRNIYSQEQMRGLGFTYFSIGR
jgi:hypothetical protein